MSKFVAKSGKSFQIDGLLTSVRLLCATYKLDYEQLSGEENTYNLFSKKAHHYIGKAYLDQKGINIEFCLKIRDVLLQVEHPTQHPESEIFELGHRDAEQMTLYLSWVLGNFEADCSDNHILIKWGQDNA